MLTNLISKIHDCSQAEDILYASMASVKQALNCDRALIFSLQAHSMGKVVAEAVNPGFPRAIETTIDDPCFQSRHIHSYREGQITTIDNAQEARLSPCYLEMLEKFAVKANLVVPLMLPDNELYGLLIVHQCAQPRAWKPEEITLAAQMALQIGWALDNALRWSECQKIHLELDRQKYYKDLLKSATRKIHQGTTRAEVLEIATAEAQTILKCDRAIVYGIAEPNLGRVFAEATLPALAPIKGSVIEDPSLEAHHIDEFKHGCVHAIDNIHEAGLNSVAIDSYAKIAVKANIVVPIISDSNEVFALLTVHQCFNYRNWHDLEVELLGQIGIQIGLALAKAQLQEEVATMRSSLKRAGVVKETISSADTQVQQVKETLNNSIQTLDEAKHLMRLLSHEVVTLTEKLSSEDINLVRIITKKLQANTELAAHGTMSLQSEVQELETVVNSAIQMYKSRRLN
jgi:GAF domain-containing protein